MGRRIILENKQSDRMIRMKGNHVKEVVQQDDDYISRVLKLIPAEIVTAYVTIDGIIKSVAKPSPFIYWGCFIFLLIITPIYIWRVTTEDELPPAIRQIIISTLSFAVWVFALGGPFTYLDWYQPYYGAILLPIFTLVVPTFQERHVNNQVKAPVK